MSVEDERPLSGSDTPTPVVQHERLATAAVETVLDVNEVMSQARRVREKGWIVLRGDLYAERTILLDELGTLVDADGDLLRDDEDTLASEDAARAEEITQRLKEIEATQRDSRRYVEFEAMADDDWQAWDKAQRDAKGDFKNLEESNTDLIALTAIAPKLTRAEVEGFRKVLGPVQIAELANAAFKACTTGGVDVPKSPGFSRSQRRDSSGRN